MASLTATADPTTGTTLVLVDQTLVLDTFTRVVAPGGWGNADSGQAWTVSGGAAADYSVNGSTGQVSLGTVNVTRHTFINSGSVDHDVRMFVTVPVVPTGAPIMVGVLGRQQAAATYYHASISIATSNVVTLLLIKVVAGVATTLGSVVLGQVHAAGATWAIRLDVCGSRLRAKAWRNTVNEPDWLLTANDFDLTTGTIVGSRSRLEAGNTNGLPVVMSWDNHRTMIGQPIRLYRVVGGVRSEVRGSPGSTEGDGMAVFWDGEGPFDVSTTYEMTSNCNTTTVVTSNAVTLVSDGDGWLRDPVDPTRNLRIVMDDFFDDCVDEDVIVFSGLDAREYANASGIFDRIQASRPATVSMIRKNLGSTLVLTSYSLDDIDGIEDILADGRILSLSLPMDYGWAHRSFGTDYITVFDVGQILLGVDQRVTARVWNLPFRLSPEPVDTSEGGVGGNGIGGGSATFDALAASVTGTTYNSLTASGFTYSQVAQGTGY